MALESPVKIRSLFPATDQSHCWVSASSYSKEFPSSDCHRRSRNFLALKKQGFVAAQYMRPGRSTDDTHQKRLSTEAQDRTVFLDLTAACDTIWHTALLVKLSRCMEPWFVQLVELLLRKRRFRVHMESSTSSWRLQKSGLPQWSVLAPILFNLYTLDRTLSYKHHLTKTAAKLKSRNNLLPKLAGS